MTNCSWKPIRMDIKSMFTYRWNHERTDIYPDIQTNHLEISKFSEFRVTNTHLYKHILTTVHTWFEGLLTVAIRYYTKVSRIKSYLVKNGYWQLSTIQSIKSYIKKRKTSLWNGHKLQNEMRFYQPQLTRATISVKWTKKKVLSSLGNKGK